jgi:hypothetical protein
VRVDISVNDELIVFIYHKQNILLTPVANGKNLQ